MIIAAESHQVAASSSARRLLRVRREADAAAVEHAMIYGRTAVSGRACSRCCKIYISLPFPSSHCTCDHLCAARAPLFTAPALVSALHVLSSLRCTCSHLFLSSLCCTCTHIALHVLPSLRWCSFLYAARVFVSALHMFLFVCFTSRIALH
jgi:hypothetical protein